ncbi:putative immunoglobulin-blocking virulence protein [Metamycoplasma alkalescens]|uniref:putative immunoglobulin-blocking virulence protein n=1 Tax=Metamycoplasma alkalescens TaxID=45363 RepID=UPI002377F01C|nr:putative immunoglobulin-blocking virulence protein [Metamycoplasma alkalescens]
MLLKKKKKKIEPVEPIITPEPTPTPKPTPTPSPIPQPIPTPKPAVSTEKQRIEIEINGVKVFAEAELAPKRILDPNDIEAGITNITPYIAQLVGKITNVEVTDELKKAVAKNLLSEKHNSLQNYADKFFVSIPEEDTELFKIDDYARQNSFVWQKIVDRFRKLLDSANVVNFLKEPAATEYKNGKQFDSINKKYAWLIRNLDYSKFTTLSGNAEKFLREGYTATAENVYINENGELDSYSYDPAPGFNVVTTRLERDNREKRVFSIDGYYGRNPDDISNGEYPGWSKAEVTSSEKFKEFNVGKDDDIKIFELTKIEKEKNGSQRKGYAVEIDANNSDGYEKTEKLIKQLQEKNIEITSYRIKNMGDKDPNQQFKKILKALPNNIQHLELFFSPRATNTSSLIELENKKIRELSLFTKGNPLLDNWSINPWAIKGVEWVNTIDYNINRENPQTVSRIVFNTLAFEESDIKENSNDKFERINLGLRMAYYVRNNEGIFQGSFGSGLNPDINEGDNSYPTRLDFSRAPSIKSLKGLIFHDIRKQNNKSRKLKNLKFFNDKPYFQLKTADLDQGQLDKVMALGEPEPPRTEIQFSNGQETIGIKFSDSNTLSTSALSNLDVLITLSKISRKIQIPKNANALKEQLKNYGYDVTETSEIDDITFN